MADSYAKSDALVSTEWVAERLRDPKIRLVEVDVDTGAYEKGHVRGAVGWNWQSQLQDGIRRDIAAVKEFEALLGASGIANDTAVILYGDNNNWFAAWALWQMTYYGHGNVRLMNGGRKKWELEKRELVTEVPAYPPTTYRAAPPLRAIRALRDDVFAAVKSGAVNLVDVRSPDEFTGKIIAPPGMTETAQRAGHIPGARNIPWSRAVNEDGSFKSPAELRALYEGAGVKPDRETIAYCRIGERSSHTWFVLSALLGYPKVRNYDGSWTEWGNLVDAPVVNDFKTQAKAEVCPA